MWGLEAVQGVLVDGLVDSALRLQGHESAVVCGVRAGVAKGDAGNVTVRVSLLVEDGAQAGGEGASDHFAQEFQVDLERLRSRTAGPPLHFRALGSTLSLVCVFEKTTPQYYATQWNPTTRAIHCRQGSSSWT